MIDGWGISSEIALKWWVNIGSDNGLVPSGHKPLPEPMLTEFSESVGHNDKLF